MDIAAAAGFDMVVIDAEHSQLDPATVLALTRHAHALSLPALVRVPAVDAGSVNQLLEAGACGIQLSSLRGVRERDALVAATRYAPGGTRSVSLAHPAADYGAQPLAAYLERSAAAPPLLVGQIETAATADTLADVLAGLDVAFLGTTDLSVDLGKPGMLDDPRVRERIAEIVDAASRAAVVLGAWVGTADALALLRDAKPRFVLVGSDLQLLRAGVAATVAAVRCMLT